MLSECEDILSFIQPIVILIAVTPYRNIKQIEDTFSSVFFFQIASSAICICSIAYLLASVSLIGFVKQRKNFVIKRFPVQESISENFNIFVMYISLGGIYMYEIFVIIYLANEITLQSDRLSYCIYESNWPCMSTKFRKLVIIIGEKWKKPIIVVVGKIFRMRIHLITSVNNS